MISRACRRAVRQIMLAVVFAPMMALAAPPPATDSIYQLNLPLTNQRGAVAALADWRGKPAIVTMFYNSCQFVCPRIVETIKLSQAKLAKPLPVLMVTFDPARDDPATLAAMAEARHLDSALWTLASTDARNVRKLAAVLGIQYRELANGEFNHSSVILLLDGEGRIVAKTSNLGEVDAAFVKAARQVK
jgi:protein SCO1